MSPTKLLGELSGRGIELTAFGDELRYRAPQGLVTPELRAIIAALKSELLAILPAHDRCTGCGAEGLRAWLTERDGSALWCPRCLYTEAEQEMARGRRPR